MRTLSAWLTYMGLSLLAGVSTACGNANKAQANTQDVSGRGSVTVTESKLSHWHDCPAQVDPGYSLCEVRGLGVSSVAFNVLRDVLNAEIHSQQALCVIDDALVRSQNGCSLLP